MTSNLLETNYTQRYPNAYKTRYYLQYPVSLPK
jgi:hypothetical protein